MAAGEIWIHNTNSPTLRFRDATNVERWVVGSQVSGRTMQQGELNTNSSYNRVYWRGNNNLVFMAECNGSYAYNNPVGALFVSGAFLYLQYNSTRAARVTTFTEPESNPCNWGSVGCSSTERGSCLVINEVPRLVQCFPD